MHIVVAGEDGKSWRPMVEAVEAGCRPLEGTDATL